MKSSDITFVGITCLAVLVGACRLPLTANQSTPQPDTNVVHAHRPMEPTENVVGIPLSATSGDLANRPYMHAKLRHSREIFEGLIMRDFSQIESSAEAMGQSALDMPGVSPGSQREDEVFAHMREEFLRLAARLQQTSRDGNLEGSAYVNEKLNATCISCHQYLRDQPTNIELQ